MYHVLQKGRNFGKNCQKSGIFQVAKRGKTLKPLEKFHTCNISQTEEHLYYLYTATTIPFSTPYFITVHKVAALSKKYDIHVNITHSEAGKYTHTHTHTQLTVALSN